MDSEGLAAATVFTILFVLVPFAGGYFIGEEKGAEKTKIEFCKVIYNNTNDYLKAIDKTRPEIIKELKTKIRG